jgi:hypothetical protein
MTDKLSLFNGSLRILKERKLASLTESREARRLLDDVWGSGATAGAVKACLQMGQWTFARRTSQIDFSPSISPSFGYRYAFDQPEDMVKPCGIYTDERCTQPLLQYADERHYWYCDLQTIYVTYVSNHATYGGDMSLWPETFIKVVEAYLAREVAPSLTNGDNAIKWANAAWKEAKLEARSDDAMRQPTRFLPPGSWSTSRRGRSSNLSLWNERG